MCFTVFFVLLHCSTLLRYDLFCCALLSSLCLSFPFLKFFLSFPLFSFPYLSPTFLSSILLSLPLPYFPCLSPTFLSFPLLSLPLTYFPFLSSPFLYSPLLTSPLLYSPYFPFLSFILLSFSLLSLQWRKLLRLQRSELQKISPTPMASHVKSTVSTCISLYLYMWTSHEKILAKEGTDLHAVASVYTSFTNLVFQHL